MKAGTPERLPSYKLVRSVTESLARVVRAVDRGSTLPGWFRALAGRAAGTLLGHDRVSGRPAERCKQTRLSVCRATHLSGALYRALRVSYEPSTGVRHRQDGFVRWLAALQAPCLVRTEESYLPVTAFGRVMLRRLSFTGIVTPVAIVFVSSSFAYDRFIL